jgi:hypothetical protein
MSVGAEMERTFRADGTIAKGCTLGGAGDDTDMTRHE